MKKEDKCILCKNPVEIEYFPMKDWNIEGVLCGKCYSKKISEYYPGKHVRVNLTDD
jgi:hypothetical protein